MSLQMAMSPFLRLKISECLCITISLSIHPKTLRLFPYPGYYEYCCNEHESTYFFQVFISFPLDMYPEGGFLDDMTVLFLIFKRTSILFCIMAIPIYIPVNSVEGFPFLHICTNTCYLLFF